MRGGKCVCGVHEDSAIASIACVFVEQFRKPVSETDSMRKAREVHCLHCHTSAPERLHSSRHRPGFRAVVSESFSHSLSLPPSLRYPQAHSSAHQTAHSEAGDRASTVPIRSTPVSSLPAFLCVSCSPSVDIFHSICFSLFMYFLLR